MKVEVTDIYGLLRLVPQVVRDQRGAFAKTFEQPQFASARLPFVFAEEFVTVSGPRVLRGMHFQAPPHDHHKVVYCLSGTILDVVVDLRVGSPTFGRSLGMELHGDKTDGLFLSTGLAHGFYVLAAPAIVAYKTTTAYSPAHDCGVRWDSIGFAWPDCDPVLSHRDRQHPPLHKFASPFQFIEAIQ